MLGGKKKGNLVFLQNITFPNIQVTIICRLGNSNKVCVKGKN